MSIRQIYAENWNLKTINPSVAVAKQLFWKKISDVTKFMRYSGSAPAEVIDMVGRYSYKKTGGSNPNEYFDLLLCCRYRRFQPRFRTAWTLGDI